MDGDLNELDVGALAFGLCAVTAFVFPLSLPRAIAFPPFPLCLAFALDVLAYPKASLFGFRDLASHVGVDLFGLQERLESVPT